MFNSKDKNFTVELENCSFQFYLEVNDLSKSTNYTVQDLLLKVQQIERDGTLCIENGNRFNGDADAWTTAGIVTLCHCVLPLLFMIIVWITLILKKHKFSFWSIPLPPISRMYQSILKYELFVNEKEDRSKTAFNEEKQKMTHVYVEEKEKKMKQISNNEILINIGIMIESGLEASFQVKCPLIYVFICVFIHIFSVLLPNCVCSSNFIFQVANPIL